MSCNIFKSQMNVSSKMYQCSIFLFLFFIFQTGNKKEAEKIVKNIIKIVIKIAVLYRNNQFTSEEVKHAEKFKNKFHQAAMAVISFYEVCNNNNNKFFSL